MLSTSQQVRLDVCPDKERDKTRLRQNSFLTDEQILEILCEVRQGLRDMTLDWLGYR